MQLAELIGPGPLICASWAPATDAEIDAAALRRVERDADLVEIRLDRIRPVITPGRSAALVRRFRRPVLATCRSVSEGGGWEGGTPEVEAILVAALEAGAMAIDVELEGGLAAGLNGRFPGSCVVSKHWADVPAAAELAEHCERLLALRPAVAKLVAFVNAPAAGRPLLDAGDRLRAAGLAACSFAMGEASGAVRLLDAAGGAPWIYAVPTGEEATARGQWGVPWLRQHLQPERWRPVMRRFGVSGHPLTVSLSPAVFNAAFAACGRAAVYLPMAGADFAAVLDLAGARAVDGLSVTMPFKQEALAIATEATPAARAAGAANTLRRVAGGWESHNTDGEGLVRALEAVTTLAGRRVVVLGGGGAARGAVPALRTAGAEVVLCVRRPDRVAATAASLGVDVVALADFRASRAQVVVNATPVGMGTTAETPIPTADLEGGEVVLDMVYRPAMTALLRGAAARGCRVVSGLEMFLHQAFAQYRWWFGDEPPEQAMSLAARRHIEDEDGCAQPLRGIEPGEFG